MQKYCSQHLCECVFRKTNPQTNHLFVMSWDLSLFGNKFCLCVHHGTMWFNWLIVLPYWHFQSNLGMPVWQVIIENSYVFFHPVSYFVHVLTLERSWPAREAGRNWNVPGHFMSTSWYTTELFWCLCICRRESEWPWSE